MKRNFLFITCCSVLVFLVLGCTEKTTKEVPSVSGAYMNMMVTDEPLLLAPTILASSLDEYNGTFSPDGKSFFFTTNTPSKGIITYTELLEDKIWSPSRVAPFSGIYSEYDPLFSPDGNRLYFSSERPLEGSENSGATHIWYVDRIDSTWSQPHYVDLEQAGNYYSSITNDGDICFNRWQDGDMYIAHKEEDGFNIERLPSPANSENDEGDPFISPEGNYIIFRAYSNSMGLGDLYITYKIENKWTAPENLGEPINSQAHEMCPYVTVDGKFLIFASSRISRDYQSMPNLSIDSLRRQHQSYDNGELNIYYISADFIEEGRKKYLQ